MLVDIYSHIFMMSIAATGLYLLLKLSGPLTLKHFTASWHYYTGITMYLFFLIPFYKLVSLAHSSFKQADGSIPGVISTIELNQSAVTNPIVSAISVIPQKIYSVTSYLDFLPYIFIAGTIIFITVVFIQSYTLNRRIFRECRLTADKQTLEIFSKCRQEMGISGEIPVYTSSYTGSPFLCGLFKPRIVLPEIKLSPRELRCVFLHELTHYKRRDTVLKCLLLLINAIQWFNPFAYIARHNIDRMCELSCDESIVKSMNDRERRQYCKLTLDILWNLADHKVKLVSAFSDKRKDTERRINMILNKGSKGKTWVRLLAATLTLALALAGSFVVSADDEAPFIDTDPTYDATFLETVPQTVPGGELQMVETNTENSPVAIVTIANAQKVELSPTDLSAVIIAGQSAGKSEAVKVTLDAEITYFEPQLEKGSIPISGDLNVNAAHLYGEYWYDAGDSITISITWVPGTSSFRIGLTSKQDGSCYGYQISGGSGTCIIEVNQAGWYYPTIWNIGPDTATYSGYISL
jgi:beta-lactamase regulating signal transducer with metallopeptidase domain